MARVVSDFQLPSLREVSTQPRYNTAAVVRLAGVPAATFRAWERRYGFPRPARLPAGQRLYSDRDVAVICWLHEQTERGLTISRAVMFAQEAVAEAEQPPRLVESGRPAEALRAALEGALFSANQARAETVLSEAFALHSVETVALEILQPLLVDVGDRWHRGELSIAEEHFVTQFIVRKLFALLNAYDDGYGRSLIITACGPGELHEVGALMVSLLFIRRGHRVLYLGPNLPLADLANHIDRLDPDLVCLSATMPESAEALVREAHRLVRDGHDRSRLAFGGRAFAENPALVERMPGHYLGPDARKALERAEQLLGSHGRRQRVLKS